MVFRLFVPIDIEFTNILVFTFPQMDNFNEVFFVQFVYFVSLLLRVPPHVCFLRIIRMMTPNWSTMWMLRTGLLWRVICSRGLVMPSKHGTGK